MHNFDYWLLRQHELAYPDCGDEFPTEVAVETIQGFGFEVEQYGERLTVYLEEDYTLHLTVDEYSDTQDVDDWQSYLGHPDFRRAHVSGPRTGLVRRSGYFDDDFFAAVRRARAEITHRKADPAR